MLRSNTDLFAGSGWAAILMLFAYVHYWRTKSPRSPYYEGVRDAVSGAVVSEVVQNGN
jgi:hypothetical protein